MKKIMITLANSKCSIGTHVSLKFKIPSTLNSIFQFYEGMGEFILLSKTKDMQGTIRQFCFTKESS